MRWIWVLERCLLRSCLDLKFLSIGRAELLMRGLGRIAGFATLAMAEGWYIRRQAGSVEIALSSIAVS